VRHEFVWRLTDVTASGSEEDTTGFGVRCENGCEWNAGAGADLPPFWSNVCNSNLNFCLK
jgi:hypothetical protein